MLLDPHDKTAPQVFDALKKGLGPTPITVESFRAGRPAELAPAFEAMKQRGVDAVLIQPDGLFSAERATIVKRLLDVSSGFQVVVFAGGFA